MSKVQFSKLDDDFAYIEEGTTLVQRHILCLTSYFPNGLRYNNKELGKFFQLSPERISHLISKLKETKFITILFEQSKYRTIFLNENHSTLMKIAKYHEGLHCCKQPSKNCLHCYFRQGTLMKTANSIKKNKQKKTKEGKGPVCADKTLQKTTTEGVVKNPQESFEKFWQAYPKKVARKEALKSWQKLSPDQRLFDEIMSALEKHKSQDSWHKDNGRFIPNPATWLNAERWTDVLTDTQAEPDYSEALNQYTREITEEEATELMKEVASDN